MEKHPKRVRDVWFKVACGLVLGAGLFSYLFLNKISSEQNLQALFSVNILLLCVITLSLLLILALLYYIQEREEELTDMRADFVAVASHELRSPLAAVRWYLAELRADAKLSQDARKITNDLYERICALVDLTTTFFLMTSADRTPLYVAELKAVDIAPSLRESIAHAISTAKPKKIKIEVQTVLDAPILVKGDAARIRIVFDNLLSNAIKYSHEGSKISFTYEDIGQSKWFAVHDNGIGVPKDELGRIFSGYHRAPNAKRAGALGSGFGLYMAKKIVDLHGGTILCESEDGKGTTFSVTIPSAL